MSEVTIIEDNTVEVIGAMESQILEALNLCGEACEGYAKGLCPVDTGRLRNSITHEVESAESAVYIGTNVDYGKYVEMGTSRMNAQPYLRPAASGHSSAYRQIFRSVLSS